MRSLNNILVAFDGSAGSFQAVKLGIDMKKRLNSNLSIIHVLEEKMIGAPIDTGRPEVIPAGGFGIQGSNIYNHNVNEGVPSEKHVPVSHPDSTEESLSELQALLAQERIEAPVEVIVGDPAKSICQFADSIESDLIIIGSRGLGGLKKLILGSVSDKVTNSANCPVLVAKY